MWSSLRFRLTIIFIGLAIGPLLLAGVILAQRSFTLEREQALDLQRQVARHVSTEIEAFLRERESELRLLGGEIRDLDQSDRAQEISLLLGMLRSGVRWNVYEELTLLDEQGQEQVHLSRRQVIPTDELGDRAGAAEFEEPKGSGKTYFGPVWLDETTGEALMTIASPVFELRSVRVRGVLVADVRFKAIGDLIAGLQVSEGQTIYVVDQEGWLVAHQGPAVALQDTRFEPSEQEGAQTGLDGTDVVLAVDKIQLGEQEFSVVVERPESEALEPAITMVFTIVATIVVTLGMASGLGFLVVGRIVRPIESLTATARAISTGNLSQQVEVTSRDEVGQLAAAFNSMTAQLRDLFGNLEQRIAERKRIEEALRESEEKFRTFTESAPVAIMIYQNYQCVYANPAAETITGYTNEELLSMKFWDIAHPDYKDAIEEWGKAIARDESAPKQHELRIVAKDGSEKWIDGRLELTEYEGKRAALISAMDVTERKLMEEALRLKDNAIASSVDAIAIAKFAGNLTYVNASFLRMWGYDDESEVLGKPAVGFWQTEENARAVVEALRDRHSWTGELVAERKDGSLFDAQVSASLVTDEAGKPICMMSSFVDVTERKRAEEERERLLAQIGEQAQRVQQIMDTVPEGVLLLDADRRVVLANPVAQGDIAVLANAAVGDTLTRLGDRPLEELLTSPPKGLWHEVEADDRAFEVIARPVEPALSLPNGNGPESENWVLVISDVTREREVERRVQQQERLAAVGQLAAGIAHDFNNLLTTIMLYAQMLIQNPGLSPDLVPKVKTILDESQQATQLVQQILDFSRRSMMEAQPLDLASSIERAIDILQRTLPENIRLIAESEAGKYVVNADPTRMQQMLMNLATNARDAMPDGGTLRIGLERIELKPGEAPPLPDMEAGEWVQLTVSDTGTGIPPDVLPHIFEPFFTTRAPLGSGLGLAQVHGIVAQHEGHIDVETQVGHGTTFTIYLPTLPVHPPEPITLESPTLPKGQGETILVVEDDAAVREALAESLGVLNYRVLEAANGQEALAILEQRREEIALVLSDVVMPGMGGIALLRSMRQSGLAMPVAMLTGHALEKELEDLRAQGIVAWLFKPPSLERLAEVVARVLS